MEITVHKGLSMIKLRTQLTMMVFAGFLLVNFPAMAAPVILEATLDGAQEAPSPGSDEGTGTVVFTLNPKTMQVCYEVDIQDLTGIDGAHLHSGKTGVSGPVVLPLKTPQSDEVSKGCTKASKKLMAQLTKNPADFYYNVHTTTYKDGALRGQLTTKSGMSQ